MAKGHWLVKTEPGSYGWERFAKEGVARWDGVRNATARRNLAEMKPGDAVLFYHTGDDKQVVGVARVARAAYPDPADAAWVAVDLEPVQPLARAVTLKEIKADDAFADLALVRQPRLSVMPVAKAAFERILKLAKQQKAPA
ncbi:MAG TPA: EVE domain-containing protein [Myxococcota bacterium]|nr:EVE domain-containing protein [Myxococcota bacterium]